MIGSVNVVKGEIQASTMNVKLKPKEYITISKSEAYSVGEAVDLTNSTLGNSEFMIKSYQIGDQFEENYDYCLTECYKGKKIIVPDTLGKYSRTLIKLEVETSIDEDLYINRYITNNSNFISIFGKVIYKVNGIDTIETFKVKDLGKIDTKNVYLEINDEIKNATQIKLIMSIRDKKYTINLKNS